MPHVKCTVSNCRYWGDENICMADQILITAGPASHADKMGISAERMERSPVQIAQDTYCLTMTPRQREPAELYSLEDLFLLEDEYEAVLEGDLLERER
jgi:hypothetical protein